MDKYTHEDKRIAPVQECLRHADLAEQQIDMGRWLPIYDKFLACDPFKKELVEQIDDLAAENRTMFEDIDAKIFNVKSLLSGLTL